MLSGRILLLARVLGHLFLHQLVLPLISLAILRDTVQLSCIASQLRSTSHEALVDVRLCKASQKGYETRCITCLANQLEAVELLSG